MKRSFLSALAGWITGAIAFAASDIVQPVFGYDGVATSVQPNELPGLAALAALYGMPVIFTIWLLVLWPLYTRIPRTSVLWYPSVCILCGAVAGTTLYFLITRFIFGFGGAFIASLPHFVVGASVGAVTCAVGSYLKRHEPKPLKVFKN